ncbi:MAG: hypothetical protein VX681_14280 [Myxococcota bacterium]|nr:hypothetical protein [Myxococcota bacterium]
MIRYAPDVASEPVAYRGPMNENPYVPPSADLHPDSAYGRSAESADIDVGRCLSEAWTATWENFPLWLGVGFVGLTATSLAAFTLLGIPLLLPHLVWGSYLFVLRMYDGEAEFGDLFAGFSRYSEVLASVLIAIVAIVLINLAFQSVQMVGTHIGSALLTGIGSLLSLGFAFFVAPRLTLCFFYIVDQDMGGIEALQAAWSATGRVKAWVFPVLVLVTSVVVLAGVLALVVGVIPAIAINYLMWASAYRQIEGRAASE